MFTRPRETDYCGVGVPLAGFTADGAAFSAATFAPVVAGAAFGSTGFVVDEPGVVMKPLGPTRPAPLGSTPSREPFFMLSTLGIAGRSSRVDWLHEVRGDDEHQLRFILLETLRTEKISENGNVADAGHLRKRLHFVVVEQARQREALAVAQFDSGLRASCSQRGNRETLELHAIREIECGNFRLEF